MDAFYTFTFDKEIDTICWRLHLFKIWVKVYYFIYPGSCVFDF